MVIWSAKTVPVTANNKTKDIKQINSLDMIVFLQKVKLKPLAVIRDFHMSCTETLLLRFKFHNNVISSHYQQYSGGISDFSHKNAKKVENLCREAIFFRGSTALNVAAHGGHRNVAELLITNIANVNTIFDSPLLLSIHRRSLDRSRN